jgi:hypothetical protein
MPDGVDAGEETVQPPGCDPTRDRPPGQARGPQLSQAHDPVLVGREPRHDGVRAEGWPV